MQAWICQRLRTSVTNLDLLKQKSSLIKKNATSCFIKTRKKIQNSLKIEKNDDQNSLFINSRDRKKDQCSLIHGISQITDFLLKFNLYFNNSC